MAFIFSRKNKRSKTWYVGYYINGKFFRKRIGRSKLQIAVENCAVLC